MTNRERLIQQLRHALHLAQCPDEMIVEFDILETTFEVDLLATATDFSICDAKKTNDKKT